MRLDTDMSPAVRSSPNHRPVPTTTGALSGLVFSDLLYAGIVTMVVYWALDPFARNLYSHPLVRWFPMIMALPVFALGWIGRRVNHLTPSPERTRLLLSLFWPLLAFSLMVLAGSLYGRFAKSVGETFLNMGLFGLVGGMLTSWWLLSSNAPYALLRSLTLAHLLWALVSVASAVLLFRKEELYHSLEFLVLPVLMLPFLWSRSWLWRALSLGLPILAAVALNKLTAYLILLVVFSVVGLDLTLAKMARARNSLQRFSIAYGAALTALLAIGSTVVVYFATKSALPTGNLEYRLHTYQRAFSRFIESPLWGRWFAESAVDKFNLFTVQSATQNLPTHSDWLDILANGGAIAMLLFAIGFARLLWIAARALLDPNRWADRAWLRPYVLVHFMAILSGLVTCALNPVLNNTNRSWAFWINVGILVAALVLTHPGNAPRNPGSTRK